MGKTQVRATLLATTAVLTIIASANAGPNLVGDPSFESGAFSAAAGRWQNTGGSGFNSLSNIGALANSGAFVFSGGCTGVGCVATSVANGVTGAGSISQSINLQPGIYQGSFFYRSAGGTPNALAASLGQGSQHNIVVPLQTDIPTNPNYQRFSFVSAAAGGTTTLALGIRNLPAFDFIDDVRLELVDDGEGNNIGAAAQTVAVQASREFLDRLQDRFNHAGSPIRMASVRETVVASAGGMSYVNASGKYRAFMSVFGSDGEWDDSAASAERRGFSAGIEANVGSLDIGAAFSLSRTDFDTQTIFTQNEGEAEEMLGAIYAHWSPSSTPVYFNLIAGYGQSTSDLTRTAFFDLGLDGLLDSNRAQDVDSSQWFASAEIGFDWAVSPSFMLTPFARVDGAMLEQDGYAEVQFATSSLPIAVVAGRDFDALRSIVGVRAGLDLDIGRGGKLGAKVGWAHDFEQDRFVTFTESTGPVSFAGVAGAATPAEDSVVAGASIELAVSDQAAVYAGYNGDFADEQEIHAGEVGLRVTW
ncbi:MAG: autotransporter outer membrane beta-barrel domain-containing protein [Micropepsaceae bacterium]